MTALKIDKFCDAYQELTKDANGVAPWFPKTFQLRDFTNFICYFRRAQGTAEASGPMSPKKSANAARTSLDISPKTLLLSLEENFNGVKKERFRALVSVFFGKLREVR